MFGDGGEEEEEYGSRTLKAMGELTLTQRFLALSTKLKLVRTLNLHKHVACQLPQFLCASMGYAIRYIV